MCRREAGIRRQHGGLAQRMLQRRPRGVFRHTVWPLAWGAYGGGWGRSDSTEVR